MDKNGKLDLTEFYDSNGRLILTKLYDCPLKVAISLIERELRKTIALASSFAPSESIRLERQGRVTVLEDTLEAYRNLEMQFGSLTTVRDAQIQALPNMDIRVFPPSAVSAYL